MIVASAVIAGCSGGGGSDGSPGTPGSSLPTSTTVDRHADAPGVVLTIMDVGGATGNQGRFRAGDHIQVTFEIRKHDRTAWDLTEMSGNRIYVSGPTFNYQRVLADRADVVARSVRIAEGTYRYTFADPIPDRYLPPLNDSSSFGPADGELSGQPLLSGTYTVGLEANWSYTVDGASFRDVGNATKDFLFGTAAAVEPREVVTNENCNACHVSVRAHGSMRQDVKLCVLCHTSGAEDRNTPTVEGGTPDVSVDFRAMIHKIHAGHSLPSVLGVTTNAQGDRDFNATPKPYRLIGFRDTVVDFSDVAFPVWPNLNIAMPRDGGYSALSAAAKAKDDATRFGPTDCAKCHGDPDGSGPLPAPAQGNLAYSEPSRRACGSCHDDVVWSNPYRANNQTMPANLGDDTCLLCHMASGNVLAPRDAHVHPLQNPALNSGLNIRLITVAEGGANNGNGKLDPGEALRVTLDMTDDGGAPIAPSALGATVSVVVSGPTSNRNLLLNGSIPTAAFVGAPPFTINVPETVAFEFVGRSTAVTGDEFATLRAPIWTVSGATTTVQIRTSSGPASSALAGAASARANFSDLASTSGFARDDIVVVDDGQTGEEYVKVALVDGNRLWFTTPLRAAHGASTPVTRVALTTKAAGTDYALDGPNGRITELTEFGDANAVLVSYTADFRIPAVYPPPLNDSPDLGETSGEWTGKSLVDGTYTVGIWGGRSFTVSVTGEDTSYRAISTGRGDFLVGGASTIQQDRIISSSSNCYSCHNDMWFHGGGRRGFETCILCHGTAGSEDRARYTAGNAPATTGVSIDFRAMLHKIHTGAELPDAATYTVVGFGGSPYPNNFTPHGYGEVEFPALPGGTQQCETCHGQNSVSWREPSHRSHPLEQAQPAREWTVACGSCHSSASAAAHFAVQTDASGQESCGVCHGEGRDVAVDLEHKPR